MVERGDKRLCGGGSSKIRQRPYLSARPGKKIFERSNETKRSSTRDVLSFFPPFSRFELTLDYCHATRHARWRGWSDRYAEGKKKKKKKRTWSVESRAWVRAWPLSSGRDERK